MTWIWDSCNRQVGATTETELKDVRWHECPVFCIFSLIATPKMEQGPPSEIGRFLAFPVTQGGCLVDLIYVLMKWQGSWSHGRAAATCQPAGQEAALGRCDQRHQGSTCIEEFLSYQQSQLPWYSTKKNPQLLKQLGEFLRNSKILSHSIHGIHGIFSHCTFTT